MFYRRYINDITNCHEKNVPNEIFTKVQEYHKKIKLTIESKAYEKPTNLPCMFLSDVKMQLAGIYTVKIRIGANFQCKIVGKK